MGSTNYAYFGKTKNERMRDRERAGRKNRIENYHSRVDSSFLVFPLVSTIKRLWQLYYANKLRKSIVVMDHYYFTSQKQS